MGDIEDAMDRIAAAAGASRRKSGYTYTPGPIVKGVVHPPRPAHEVIDAAGSFVSGNDRVAQLRKANFVLEKQVMDLQEELRKQKKMKAKEALKVIINEVRNAEDSFVEGGIWITRITQGITQAIKEEEES